MENPQHEQRNKELEQHEVGEVLNFLKRYGKMIGTGVIAATVVVLASRGTANLKAAKLAKSEQALSEARTPEQLEEVIKSYKSTPAAPVAQLELAKTRFNSGDTAHAREQYEQFLRKYKKHELRPAAELGLAYCTEAEGNFAEAAARLAAFMKDNEESYLVPMATLARARCLEQAGQTDEARIALEDMLMQYADSPWRGDAEEALRQLGN